MPIFELHTLTAVSAAAGLFSHWGYFIRGEHHMQAPALGTFYSLAAAAIYFFESSGYRASCSSPFTDTSKIILAYIFPLFTSIFVYRCFFHRLNSFPGPRLARVSKLWHSWQCITSRNHLLMEKLNRQYGPIVRTGPAEVTVFAGEAIYAIDGPGTKCSKSDWYDNIQPMKSLENLRDKEEHDARRKVWDQAMNAKALKYFETRILHYAAQLEQHLSSTAGSAVHINEWFNFYSFDIMGDIAFGKSFNMLTEEKCHYSIVLLKQFMAFQGPISPVPWLVRLGFEIPGLAKGWWKFIEYCKVQALERVRTKGENNIASFLIDHSIKNNTLKQDKDYLEGDALGMIIAGSDTTATTLTFIFYHLALYPSYQEELREELKTVPNISDIQALQSLPLLKSIIMESLRLFPPVLTGGVRLTPLEGITICDTFIPGGIAIFAPRYNISRLESAYEQACDFIPERWTSRPEMIKNKRAWSPFSQGRHSCIGKSLAMRNISYVVALLISKYNVVLAPGEDGTRILRDMKDSFTADPGRLDLSFKLRKPAASGED